MRRRFIAVLFSITALTGMGIAAAPMAYAGPCPPGTIETNSIKIGKVVFAVCVDPQTLTAFLVPWL